MRKLMVAGFAALAVAGASATATAQAPRSAAAVADTRDQIASSTAVWSGAISRNDVAALRQIMAPEFTLTEGDASAPVPLDAWLTNLGRMSIASYSAEVVDVRSYGSVAVASVRGEWDVTMNGRRLQTRFGLVDFWIWRDGRWQVFRRHMIE
jgi:hypothetical protein